MAVELKIPSVGESVTEVEIANWLKSEGDTVEKDEPVVEVDTDKVSVEIPAPVAGTLKEIKKKAGDTAEVDEVIALIEESGESGGESKKDENSEEEPEKKKADKQEDRKEEKKAEKEAEKEEDEKKESKKPAKEKKSAAKEEKKSGSSEDVRVMPAARLLLEKHNLSADDIEPTGPGGRLLKEDVLRYVEEDKDGEPRPKKAAKKEASKSSPKPEPPKGPSFEGGDREEESVRMSPMRRRIAERLVEVQQEAALLTTFNEIDMSSVMNLRKQHQDVFVKKHGIKLGFMSFFVKATIEALKQFPAINAEIKGDDIVYKNYYDIGIAIGSEKGLVVPILRNAERLSFAEVEKAIADFAQRADDRTLEFEELQGGTFTITNGGVYGSLLSTPIINPPQSGVLGMHTIQDRPVAENGQVVIRPMMYVALTYDHRIVDGKEAVTFLRRIKEVLETPARMLLEI